MTAILRPSFSISGYPFIAWMDGTRDSVSRCACVIVFLPPLACTTLATLPSNLNSGVHLFTSHTHTMTPWLRPWARCEHANLDISQQKTLGGAGGEAKIMCVHRVQPDSSCMILATGASLSPVYAPDHIFVLRKTRERSIFPYLLHKRSRPRSTMRKHRDAGILYTGEQGTRVSCTIYLLC
jgi:hypothetical protein